MGHPGGPCCHRVLCFGGGDEGEFFFFFLNLLENHPMNTIGISFFNDTIISMFIFYEFILIYESAGESVLKRIMLV